MRRVIPDIDLGGRDRAPEERRAKAEIAISAAGIIRHSTLTPREFREYARYRHIRSPNTAASPPRPYGAWTEHGTRTHRTCEDSATQALSGER